MKRYMSDFEISVFTVNKNPELIVTGIVYPVLSSKKKDIEIRISNYQNNSDANKEDCEKLIEHISSIVKVEAGNYINNMDSIFSKCPTLIKTADLFMELKESTFIIRFENKILFEGNI